jgi:hypothetical protein
MAAILASGLGDVPSYKRDFPEGQRRAIVVGSEPEN